MKFMLYDEKNLTNIEMLDVNKITYLDIAISNKEETPEQFIAKLDFIKKCNNISKLRVRLNSNNDLTDFIIDKIISVIKSINNLEYLCLKGTFNGVNLTKKQEATNLLTLLNSLSELNTLKTLDLSINSLSGFFDNPILDSLEFKPLNIKSLTLEENHLNILKSSGIDNLYLNFIGKMQNLESLNLKDNYIGHYITKELEVFVNGISNCKKLTNLNLDRNELVYIATHKDRLNIFKSFLEHLPNLKTLMLKNNDLGNLTLNNIDLSQLFELFKSIGKCNNLEKLSLSRNNFKLFDSDFSVNFTNNLIRLKNLMELDIADNNMYNFYDERKKDAVNRYLSLFESLPFLEKLKIEGYDRTNLSLNQLEFDTFIKPIRIKTLKRISEFRAALILLNETYQDDESSITMDERRKVTDILLSYPAKVAAAKIDKTNDDYILEKIPTQMMDESITGTISKIKAGLMKS